jgi:hypothetical protein
MNVKMVINLMINFRDLSHQNKQKNYVMHVQRLHWRVAVIKLT